MVGEKKIRRLLAKGGGALLIVVLGILLFAWPVDKAAMSGIRSLLNGLFQKAEMRLGVTISYENASPSILGSFAISSLTLATSDSRDLMRAGRFDLAYNLPSAIALLRGKSAPGGTVGRVTLRNVNLSMDLEKDSALIDSFRKMLVGTPKREGVEASARPLEIYARRVHIELRDPSRKAVWSADIRSMDLAISDREINVAINGSVSGDVQGSGLPVTRITLPIVIKGRVNKDFTNARFSLSLAGKSDVGTLEPQEFAVLLKDGVLEARKVRDNAPLDLYVRYNTSDKTLEAETRFESLNFSRLAHPAGVYRKTVTPWFAGPYSGYAYVKFPGSWKDTQLRLDLNGSLPKNVLGDQFRFAMKAEGNRGRISLTNLEITSPNGHARTYGTVQPEGGSIDLKTEIDYGFLKGKLPFRSNMSVIGEGKDIFLYSEKSEVAGAEFKELAIFATRNQGSIDFRGGVTLPLTETKVFSSDDSTGKEDKPVGGGTVTWEGAVSLGKAAFLEGAVQIDPYDLAPLEPVLRTFIGSSFASVLSKTTMGGRFTITSDFKRFSYSATSFRIARSGNSGESEYAEFNLSGTSESLNISKLHALFGNKPLDGKLEAEFADPRKATFKAEVSFTGIPYSLHGTFGNSRLDIFGDYGFYLSTFPSGSGVHGMAGFQALPVVLDKGLMLASAELTGDMWDSSNWGAVLSFLELEPDGSLKGKIPSFYLSGKAGPQGADFPVLRMEDLKSKMTGAARLNWNLPDGKTGVEGELSLAAKTGEALRLDGRYADDQVSGQMNFQSFSISHFWGDGVSGDITGSIKIKGSTQDPKTEFAFSLLKGSLKGNDFTVSADGSLDKHAVTIRDASGRYGMHQAQAVKAVINFDTGNLTVEGGYSGLLAEENLKFQFSAKGNLDSSVTRNGGINDLAGSMKNISLEGNLNGLTMGSYSVNDWPFFLELHPSEMSFSGGTNSEVMVRILEDGSFLGRAVPPFPFSALVVGRVADKQIAMDVSDIRIEMPVLWPLVSIPDVRFMSGVATGALSVRGNASDPEIYGSLRFQDTILEVPNYINAPIGPVTAPMEANGRQVTLIQPAVTVGQNAKANVSLSMEMSQWVPRSFSLRVRSLESTQIPLKTKFLGVTVQGVSDADIHLTIENNLLELAGNLIIPKADVIINPSVVQSGGTEAGVPRSNTKIDLGIQIGKGVTVYFPSKEFPVILGQADPASRLTVSYDDREQAFALRGNAVLRGGNLFYIQRNFYLKSGKMVFNENQYSFDPRVTLEAELRTRNDIEPVKITLRAENQSLVNFQPTLESSPSLSQAEIASLLGSDLIGADDESDVDIRRTLIASSDIIPQLNFVNVFERNTRRLLGLDIFYLRTEIIQRWLLDVANLDTNSSSETEGEATIADYLDNTSVYMGKYLRDEVFIHGMLQLQKEKALVHSSALTLDSEIGFELTTPFFLFDWSLALEHPENLFVSDNSFSFTWRLSY